MIKNFEELTQPLTDYEKAILPRFISELKPRIGKRNAIKNQQIIALFKPQGIQLNGPRIRKLINHVRTHDLVEGLIATSGGYYIATTEKELTDYEQSLKGREDAIRSVRFAITLQRGRMFRMKEWTLFD